MYEALDRLKEHEFSLVLSDIDMPRMDGVKLLQALQAGHPDIEVVMITGVVDVEVALQAIRMGASDYLTKPFNLEEVRFTIQKALEKRRLILENREYQRNLEEKVAERTAQVVLKHREIESLFVWGSAAPQPDDLPVVAGALLAADPVAAADWMRAILTGRDESLRLRTLNLLPELGVEAGAGFIPLLVQLLESAHEATPMRTTAALVLARFNPESADPALWNALQAARQPQNDDALKAAATWARCVTTMSWERAASSRRLLPLSRPRPKRRAWHVPVTGSMSPPRPLTWVGRSTCSVGCARPNARRVRARPGSPPRPKRCASA